MAMAIRGGPQVITLDVDDKAHRVYKVTYLVESDDLAFDEEVSGIPLANEAVDAALNAPNMPRAGDFYGSVERDGFTWAYCLPDAVVRKAPSLANQPGQFYTVEKTFTTRPIERRLDLERGDPLLEDIRVSGSTIRFQEEAVYDRNNKRIVNSALEQIRGEQNKWDMSRPVFRVEQQVYDLDHERIMSMMNCVNDAPLWGLPKRCLKLSDFTYSELYVHFRKFYSRVLTFEGWTRRERSTDPVSSGWDRNVLDEGTKVLRGRWQNFGTPASPVWQWVLIGNPSRFSPGDFQRFQDPNGNVTSVILDGQGRPYQPTAGPTVSTCTQCPDGAPQQWDMSGVYFEPAIQGLLLDHSGGCVWGKQATGKFGQAISAILSWNVTHTGYWTLSVTGLRFTASIDLGEQRWELIGTSWQCASSNALTGSSANSDLMPETMTLTPAVANSPGNIHIERYLEANFLELGVPATL